MKKTYQLVCICLFLLGICITQSDRLAANPVDVDNSWKTNRQQFVQKLSAVQKGWTEQQVLDHLGEPESKVSSVWHYSWIESKIEGGYYLSYSFTFKNQVVIDIKPLEGHKSIRQIKSD